MSDAAIATIAGTILQVVVLVIGLLTLWIKIKYGADKAEESVVTTNQKAEEIERKIDDNTAISKLAADSASKAEHQTNGVLTQFRMQMTDHTNRIVTLEAQITAIKSAIDNVKNNVDNTRDEMRGHLQTIGNKLDLISLKGNPPAETK